MVDELEWQTRRDRINKRLQSLNPPWSIIKYTDELDSATLAQHAVEEYPTASGPADYALFVNGRLLGIIEAKKVKVGPQNVLEQAKRYAKGAFNNIGAWSGYKVPFLYASNGEGIWFLDVRHPKNIARQLGAFHTPDALGEFFDNDLTAGYDLLQAHPAAIKDLRPYQLAAVQAIESAIAKRKRAMLLAMAFRGELVPQNPNDEPASELLKRIKAEKARQEAEGKPNRKPKTKKRREKKRAGA